MGGKSGRLIWKIGGWIGRRGRAWGGTGPRLELGKCRRRFLGKRKERLERLSIMEELLRARRRKGFLRPVILVRSLERGVGLLGIGRQIKLWFFVGKKR